MFELFIDIGIVLIGGIIFIKQQNKINYLDDVLQGKKQDGIVITVDRNSQLIMELIKKLGYLYSQPYRGMYIIEVDGKFEKSINAILEYNGCEIVSVPEKPEHFEIKKKD